MKYYKLLLNFKKLTFFLVNSYLKIIQIRIWKKVSIMIDRETTLLGFPIITNTKGALIQIGKNCLICSRSEQTALGVSHKTILRTLSPESNLIIGNFVRMSGTTICSASSIKIGDRCVIGADVMITDTDFHSLDHEIRSSKLDSKHAHSNPVIIGNDVFIGGKSIILKGVTLGNRVIVGAGSVVTRSFPDDSIIGGNPAKLIKTQS